MTLMAELAARADGRPFLLSRSGTLSLDDVLRTKPDFSGLRAGDVVVLEGGFDPVSIATLLRLLDEGMIVAPITPDTAVLHEQFFRAARADALVYQGRVTRLPCGDRRDPLLKQLRDAGEGGLILFTSGTTGVPKAILHGAKKFLARFRTPRPALRALAFLRFDHIGGLNTLLHTLFNGGETVTPDSLRPEDVWRDIRDFSVRLLPASPTFLRLSLLSGFAASVPPSLELVTYGTERMDQGTLEALCEALPDVDFRQTYGMSELGILRVKSWARNSLWMRVGGEGVETKIEDGCLHIRSENRMLGYLNAPWPFDGQGWYDTQDMVETERDAGGDAAPPWLRIIGRRGDGVNVGGLKVMPAEVERAALSLPGVRLAKAFGASNPLTGQHVELLCEVAVPPETPDKAREAARALTAKLEELLPPHAVPRRIRFQNIPVSHRMKQQ
ncbi:MAG: long-chain fatty acid--CoA ligase [Desulfovibrio sp.]|jgi:acyl-coenzyme A synthetase/AMP-(fatty) acid ligase|nr:long-chain fatty acid--CoA ligase [Desulfovibrio sp.]